MIPLAVHALAAGDRGTIQTLHHMAQFAKDGVRSDVRLHRLAQMIAANTDDPERRLLAIYNWLGAAFTFKPDAKGFEQIRTPTDMLDQFEKQGRIAGDCDDLSIMGAALIMAMGYPAGFVIIARTETGRFVHVYPSVYVGKTPVPMDPQEGTPFGQHTRGAARITFYKIDA